VLSRTALYQTGLVSYGAARGTNDSLAILAGSGDRQS
jgi:hypothetical protein